MFILLGVIASYQMSVSVPFCQKSSTFFLLFYLDYILKSWPAA